MVAIGTRNKGDRRTLREVFLLNNKNLLAKSLSEFCCLSTIVEIVRGVGFEPTNP